MNFYFHFVSRIFHTAVLISLCSIPLTAQSENLEVEKRVIEHIRANLKMGEPVVVSKLYNEVFTSAEERKVLDRLYNIFFKVPAFVAQYYVTAQKPPTLQEIAQQFKLPVEGEAEVILKIIEFDRRVPKFITRDPGSGEIVDVDIDKIKADPRFNKVIERSIAGWEGRVAPPFTAQLLGGSQISSADLKGKTYLIYFWFTHCPPCVQITPHLVDLQNRLRDRNFSVIGLNADRFLELGYEDAERKSYAEEHGINFPIGHLTAEVQSAYGGVQLFPTLFLVDKSGVIRAHFVNYQEEATLQNAIESIL